MPLFVVSPCINLQIHSINSPMPIFVAADNNFMETQSNLSAKNLAACFTDFADVKTLFFDVSDTLYVNEELEKQYPKVLTELVAKGKGISFDEAKVLIAETTERLTQTESHVTKVRAFRELGFSREDGQVAIATIRPQEYLQEDSELAEILELLGKRYQFGLITNLRKAHLIDVLRALGLAEGLFTYYVTEDVVEETKPHPEPFIKAIAMSGISAGECCYIADSPTKDIQPAKLQGMKTIILKATPNENDLSNADACIKTISEIRLLA